MSIIENERQEAAKEATMVTLQTSRENFARKLYADGVDLATISRYTDLPITELERLLLAKAS